MLLIIVAFFLLTVPVQRATLTPVLTCWFPAFSANESTRDVTLVLGYNNTDSFNVRIHVQRQLVNSVALKNIITPQQYNGEQPDVFKPGLHTLTPDMVVRDSLHILRTHGDTSINWYLGTALLTVRAASLTSQNRCDILFPRHCPVRIAGFCEDALFCNGRETCFANFQLQDGERYGVCRPATTAVTCPLGQFCSEQKIACSQPLVPAPIATRSPTPAPIVDVIEEVTNSPTVSSRDCKANSDCLSRATFCKGKPLCIDNRCQFNASYNPCRRETGVSSAADTRVIQLGIPTRVCSDERRACLIYFSCVNDSDCDDRLYCTGTEHCSNGMCVRGRTVRCRNASMTCDEERHCNSVGSGGTDHVEDELIIQVTNSPTAAPTEAPTVAGSQESALAIFGLTFGAAVLLLLVIVIFCILRVQENRRLHALSQHHDDDDESTPSSSPNRQVKSNVMPSLQQQVKSMARFASRKNR